MRLALTRGDGVGHQGTAQRGADPRAWWRGVTAAAHRFEKIAADDGAPRNSRERATLLAELIRGQGTAS